jgi:hypothetical protein
VIWCNGRASIGIGYSKGWGMVTVGGYDMMLAAPHVSLSPSLSFWFSVPSVSIFFASLRL